MEATWAIWPLESVSLAMPRSEATAASTPASMPFLSDIGLAPAATLRRPSWTMAQASTVAVVVPSPATSSVFLATSLTSSAPILSKGSSSSISLAMETPSLVMVGAPHFLSRTTLRPFGPRVTRTASASLFMPLSRARRASSSNVISLAIWCSSVSLALSGSSANSKPRARPGRNRGAGSRPDHRSRFGRAGGAPVLVGGAVRGGRGSGPGSPRSGAGPIEEAVEQPGGLIVGTRLRRLSKPARRSSARPGSRCPRSRASSTQSPTISRVTSGWNWTPVWTPARRHGGTPPVGARASAPGGR